MSRKDRASDGFERLAELANAPEDYKRRKSDSQAARRDATSGKSDKSGKGDNKKRSPKKKDVEQKPDEQRTACKTPQVMKLVERTNDVNPVILAGKSRVPSRLRGRESLTRMMRRGLGEEFADEENTVVVNITELAIEHEAPLILDRFNACSCDKCVEVFSRMIAEKVPVRFARVNKIGRDLENRELSERVAPMRKIVLTEMIKVLIGSKKRCFHDDLK